MRIAIGSDHAGFRYKEMFKKHLTELGHTITDYGTDSEQSVDYPIYCHPPAMAVSRGEVDRGIVLGGSGNGEAIVANRVRGVRCIIAWNIESARLGRAHNDANMLSVGERMVSEQDAIAILDTWLTTAFDAGRHLRRIEEIDELTS